VIQGFLKQICICARECDVFGSTKHKVVIGRAKYSVFKDEILNQSFFDAPSITALFLCEQNFRGDPRTVNSVNDFVFLSRHTLETKKGYLWFYET